jgi:hypothetical protein
LYPIVSIQHEKPAAQGLWFAFYSFFCFHSYLDNKTIVFTMCMYAESLEALCFLGNTDTVVDVMPSLLDVLRSCSHSGEAKRWRLETDVINIGMKAYIYWWRYTWTKSELILLFTRAVYVQ